MLWTGYPCCDLCMGTQIPPEIKHLIPPKPMLPQQSIRAKKTTTLLQDLKDALRQNLTQLCRQRRPRTQNAQPRAASPSPAQDRSQSPARTPLRRSQSVQVSPTQQLESEVIVALNNLQTERQYSWWRGFISCSGAELSSLKAIWGVKMRNMGLRMRESGYKQQEEEEEESGAEYFAGVR
ncbi:hypothetical protein EV426DRAFT_570289 [Tirmania nivea]|nr:hypothetical protein EV426DRAFT_570289 [Tirmania nivea]